MKSKLKRGLKPLDIIFRWEKFFQTDIVYDLWVWTWRNSLYLHNKWYKIYWVDKDIESLLLLKKYLWNNIANFNLIHSDIESFIESTDLMENVILTFTLRFLWINFHKILTDIQNKTPIWWVHILVDFLQDESEFYNQNKEIKNQYWLWKEELLTLYNDWEIIDFYDEYSPTKVIYKGERLFWKISCIAAIKK